MTGFDGLKYKQAYKMHSHFSREYPRKDFFYIFKGGK